MNTPAYDLSPLLGIAAAGLVLALLPLLWLRWRRGLRSNHRPGSRLRALALLTLFLSFDLVLLGAYTRLSDSGLGCPDWPGCYGQVSPVGAREAIAAAEAAAPLGPVTHRKAWIEMAHRYAATAIGALIVVLAGLSLVAARRGTSHVSPAWALATLAWVCLQGAFGAWTVTMKLYPAIVTLHLLGGLGLLVLLAIQVERYEPVRLEMSAGVRAALIGVAMIAFVQIALGGWVSTNNAVLACRDFPTCQGVWWPSADFAQGFAVRRPLGQTGSGEPLPFQALTAIHMAHRWGAYLLLPALVALGWQLRGHGQAARPWALALIGIAVWQAASGLGNVVWNLPLAAAVAHTAGGAALAVVLAALLVRSAPSPAARNRVGVASPVRAAPNS